jgi:hypothetical protein
MAYTKVAAFTWKKWGINLEQLKSTTTLEQFKDYEEIMHVENDYEYATMKDTAPPQK